jgi:hypothetical protein
MTLLTSWATGEAIAVALPHLSSGFYLPVSRSIVFGRPTLCAPDPSDTGRIEELARELLSGLLRQPYGRLPLNRNTLDGIAVRD